MYCRFDFFIPILYVSRQELARENGYIQLAIFQESKLLRYSKCNYTTYEQTLVRFLTVAQGAFYKKVKVHHWG